MSNKTLIIIAVSIVVGFILLGGCFIGGVLYQKEKDKFQKVTDLFEYLGSLKIISSFVITGEVTKISGRTVTLSSGTENLSITINEDMQVFSFNSGIQTGSAFESIKIGDKLIVSGKVLSDGQFEILSVVIIPLPVE
jgi:hypothetical protein